MFGQCWPTVYYVGPTLAQHCGYLENPLDPLDPLDPRPTTLDPQPSTLDLILKTVFICLYN